MALLSANGYAMARCSIAISSFRTRTSAANASLSRSAARRQAWERWTLEQCFIFIKERLIGPERTLHGAAATFAPLSVVKPPHLRIVQPQAKRALRLLLLSLLPHSVRGFGALLHDEHKW